MKQYYDTKFNDDDDDDDDDEIDGENLYDNSQMQPIGFKRFDTKTANSNLDFSNKGLSKTISLLREERKLILINSKLSGSEKIKFFENNRRTLLILCGAKTRKTDKIIYAILGFGMIIILALSILNVFNGLTTEITITFIGTTMGGLIASITQKLGKYN